jgi:hypothetical protein
VDAVSVGCVVLRVAPQGFNGPAWSFPEFSKKGTHWKVTACKVTCEFATRWAMKLLKTKYKGEAATKLKGPAGWHCLPSIPHGGGVPGECRLGSKLFSWGPDAKL